MKPKSRGVPGVIAMVSAAALLLGGCSAGDVELNGKVFDYLGVSPSAQTKTKEPKLADRGGLVVPPSLDRLPAPGSEAAAEDAQLAEINDPDRKKVADKAELERQQAEYCKVHYEQALARGDQTAADLAAGPLGACRPSIFTALQKWNKSE